MRVLDGETIYSATDLVASAACAHLTQLELSAARGKRKRPNREDPLLEVLSRRGTEHEANVLAGYPNGSEEVVTIKADTKTRAGLVAAAQETIAAMRTGAPLIYQATFFHDSWVGHADFLERVESSSALGGWSYEVADAKLARSVKSAAIVQMCEYSDHVTRIQGDPPEKIHVLTGDGERHSFPLSDFSAYYRTLKARFLATTQAATPPPTYPDPIGHCHICRWWAECGDRRRDDDHLSLVAGMRREQTKRLVEAGVTTRTALANASEDLTTRVSKRTYEKLRLQAALQVKGENASHPLYELLPPAVETDDDEAGPPQGFGALPEPSPGDVFLDLEGDPYALDGGLEYLFGLVEVVDGKQVYHPFWAHTRADEGEAFRDAVDLIVDRRKNYPDMHVYHYAAYEQTAFRRLMGAHGTREDEIDDLLRGGAFVDLYRVVCQSIRSSTESYGLKSIEKFYFERPDGEVMDAGSSIITYETYLVDGDQTLLDEIAEYNRDDCVSLIGLQDWLERLRLEAEAEYGPIARPKPREDVETEEEADARAQLAARLLADLPEERADRSDEQQGQYLLAHLLEWHRREAKPTWWRFFDRCAYAEADEFVNDPECIGGLEFVEEVGVEKQSTVYRMRFAPQEHKFRPGDSPADPATGKQAGTIVAVDDAGTLDVKRATRFAAELLPQALIPGGPIRTDAQQSAIAAVATWVADNGIDAPGPYRAIRDLLMGRLPRIVGTETGAPLRDPEAVPLDEARRIARALDETCLPVQGPPGAGKTHTGGHMIVELLQKGQRVGITSTTHSAIANLLAKVSEVAVKEAHPLRAMRKADADPATAPLGVEVTGSNEAIENGITDGSIELAAGTAWLWAREGMRDAVDVLFVDEAGQMSLADVVAVGTSAQNIVLLGDPQQLAQPSTGSHPDGAGASALEHVLGAHFTLPPERGLFLDKSWRMHPKVCAYISEIAYEKRLESAPDRERQLVDGTAGLRFVPVPHEGDRTRSKAEAEAVAALISELVGKSWTNEKGETRPLKLDDIIVVAPYNAHVAELRTCLPDGARVGTVDKFQGLEGAVAIYSTASSTAEDAPRGMDFLYDLHRLNVAVSRAQARAYVVASPELLNVLCQNPTQLRLANALCRYVERADASQPE